MTPILDRILAINLVFSTVIFYAAARLYLLPRLGTLTPRVVLVPILLLHSMRHLGLMFLAPGVALPGLPPRFAWPAALGDLATAILALISIAAVTGGWQGTRVLLWTFSIVGSVDLALAIADATAFDAAPFMGAAYWIPSFWVPALLVTHYVTFVFLGRLPPVPAI